MKIMKHELLVWYDGPQLEFLTDENGEQLISVAIPTPPGGEWKVFAALMTPEQKDDFKNGLVDLRELLQNPQGGKWYLNKAHDEGDFLLLEEIKKAEVEKNGEDWLPSEGFMYSDCTEKVDASK